MIFEVTPHDLYTVNPAFIASSFGLFSRLSDVIRDCKRVRLLMVAANWEKNAIVDAFDQQTIATDDLPPMLMLYRGLLETYLRQSVSSTRYMQVYLVVDTKQPEQTVLNALRTYGIQARRLTHAVPIPFSSVQDKFNRGIDDEGKRWAIVRSEMQQTGIVGLNTLHGLFSLPFPVWLSLEIDQLSNRESIDLIKRKVASARFTKTESKDYEVTAQATDVQSTAAVLRAEVQQTGTTLHHVRLSVLIGANDEETLKERLNRVRSNSGMMMERWESPISGASSMFDATSVKPFSGSLVTTRGVVAAIGSAATYKRRTDTRGIIVGFDTNQAPYHIDLFDDRFPSYGVVVLGQAGAGKTFAVQLMLLRHLLLGCRVIIIDPQGNVDWSWMGEDLCQTVKLGRTESKINVLDQIYDELPEQMEHVLSVLKMLGVYGDDESDRLARSLLDQTLTQLYSYGDEITLHDLEAALQDVVATGADELRGIAQTVVYRLQQYTNGSQSELFGHQSTVDFSLSTAVTVFDISGLPSPEKEGNLRAALLAVLMGNTDRAIRRLRASDDPAATAPIAYFVDEIGVLMRDQVIASNVSYQYKTCRSRLVAMIVADQDLPSLLGREDEYGTRHGEPMLAMANIMMSFYQKEGQRKYIDEHLPEIPDALRERIYVQKRGQCVIQTPHDVAQIRIEPSENEVTLLSSRLQDREKRDLLIKKLREVYS